MLSYVYTIRKYIQPIFSSLARVTVIFRSRYYFVFCSIYLRFLHKHASCCFVFFTSTDDPRSPTIINLYVFGRHTRRGSAIIIKNRTNTIMSAYTLCVLFQPTRPEVLVARDQTRRVIVSFVILRVVCVQNCMHTINKY